MTNWHLKTTVAFSIFNRPETTEKVFEEIRKARPTKLLVIADGPRRNVPGEYESCKAARAIIERVDWPCEVLKNYSDINLGCKGRMSSGLNWVFDCVEEAIILEDDCLPHPDFFRFCEALLERYRDDERVMMISGTNYLLNKMKTEESYIFSRYFAIWGWASWRRAWAKYDINMKGWEVLNRKESLKSFYYQKGMRKYITSMFNAAYKNEINTWDIQWFYSCLFNDGLCIVPKVNLVSNIGVEGTHTSGDVSNHFLPVFPLDTNKLIHPQYVFADNLYDSMLYKKRLRMPLIRRIKSKIYTVIKRILK